MRYLQLFEGLNNYQLEVDSVVRSSIWRAVKIEWGEAVKNKSKLKWWRRELAKNGDRHQLQKMTAIMCVGA